MNIPFYKYQGTGNDFVMIDNRSSWFPQDDVSLINAMCDRRFGIGADGLILLEKEEGYDFKMVYFNADGNQSTMCGNGGRCLVAFAHFLNIVQDKTTFIAIDGPHYAEIHGDQVSLQMIDVPKVEVFSDYNFVETGSPHHVQLVEDLDGMNVKQTGAQLRYGKYGESGANINFVTKNNEGGFKMRTYERGVEDETLSCGTGATAVALAMHETGQIKENEIPIKVPGGDLKITFKKEGQAYKEVFLIGPAKQVFKGDFLWQN